MIDKTQYIYGIHAVLEALDAGKDIDKILRPEKSSSRPVHCACPCSVSLFRRLTASPAATIKAYLR